MRIGMRSRTDGMLLKMMAMEVQLRAWPVGRSTYRGGRVIDDWAIKRALALIADWVPRATAGGIHAEYWLWI